MPYIIKDYEDKYAEEVSKIITENLLKVNSLDYGLEFVQKTVDEYTPEGVKEIFSKRTKVFIALEQDKVVGTAGIDKSWHNADGEYWILTVFVDIVYHGHGVGRMLINKVEEFAKNISAKKLVIPASIAGCEFYHKLGYEYKDGKKELNEGKMYIMEKYL